MHTYVDGTDPSYKTLYYSRWSTPTLEAEVGSFKEKTHSELAHAKYVRHLNYSPSKRKLFADATSSSKKLKILEPALQALMRIIVNTYKAGARLRETVWQHSGVQEAYSATIEDLTGYTFPRLFG
jgi:hypothetical protein